MFSKIVETNTNVETFIVSEKSKIKTLELREGKDMKIVK